MNRREAAAALLWLISAAAVLATFHDQFWWPVDEGVYAYVAQRANAGDVIHRDLIDIHSGYGNILNAWAFRVLGEDLLSLRYPLVAITFLQGSVAFIILRRRGSVAAFAGAFAVTVFSFIQFPNPSANWHALGAFFLLCLCLGELHERSALRLVLAGAIVGLCFFTRQLSGVMLALGLVAVLLAERREDKQGERGPALLAGGVAFSGLCAYVVAKNHTFGLIWGGILPSCILLILAFRARITWVEAGRTVALVLAGFVLSGLPLAAVVASQGALGAWINDMIFSALVINGQDFIADQSFGTILLLAAHHLLQGDGPVVSVSAVAWVLLLLSVPALCLLVAFDLLRNRRVHPLAVLSVFWSVLALHYQIPIYLLFVVPTTLVSLILMRPSLPVIAAVLALCLWSLAFQAGQPLDRGLGGTVAGVRAPPNIQSTLPRVGLRIQASDDELFRQLLQAIEASAEPNELLMTLPMEPELNFITGRPSPVPYYGTPLGLRTEADLVATIAALERSAPLNVVHRRVDKYLTPLSAELLDRIRAWSGPPRKIGPFDLYRFAGPPSPPRSFSQ